MMVSRPLRLSRAAAVLAPAALVGLSWTGRASAACAGVELPPHTRAFGETLTRNGVGLREATFMNVDVYVAGLYLEQQTRDARRVLEPGQAKVIILRFVRDVDREEMVDTMREALKNNVGDSFAMVDEHMRQFVRRLPQLREGTQLTLAYRPGHGVELRVNRQLLGIDRSDAFGNLVFNAWLGPRPPDADLKLGLLGGPCR